MLRLDCLRSVYSELEDYLVVTIMGAVAAELQSLGHRPNFFYLQHDGPGIFDRLRLALCLPNQRVIVFDGDGSLNELREPEHDGALSPKESDAR